MKARPRHLALLLAALSVPAFASTSSGGAEAWADATLPVKSGLVLWLDASRQNAARQARQLPMLADHADVDLWFDGSGRNFHLSQPLSEARPHLHMDSAGAAVAFDGKDDFLLAENLRLALTNATLFIEAAPLSNTGGFRALLAINQFGRNDYTSGFTVDLGPGGGGDFAFLNIEGAGFGGAVNLLKGSKPFGGFHSLAILTEEGPNGLQMLLAGVAGGARERKKGLLAMDQLTVGARRYSNIPTVPPIAQGFFHGEIAEVLLYDRILDDREREQVQKYLSAKYASFKAAAADP